MRISEETLVYDAKKRNEKVKKSAPPPMLNPDQKILIEFVEDRAIRLPVRKRIKVYRGLADFIDDRAVANPLVKKAQILEAAESKCTQLNLNFPGARPTRRPRRSSTKAGAPA